jgi:N-acetylmuramoyl-L-alanine amidase
LLFIEPATASAQLTGKRIGVDAGHGGTDAGSSGPTGLREKDINLSTALALQTYLAADGASVFMTRVSDVTTTPSYRTTYLNSQGVDRVVSVHHNATGNTTTNRTMDFVYCGYCSSTSSDLATKVINRVATSTSLTKGPAASTNDALCSGQTSFSCGISGVGQANLFMVRDTVASATLVEVSFITSSTEETKLRDSNYLDSNGWAVYAGVADHYGVTPKPRGGSGQSCKSLTLVRSPSNGGTIEADPIGTVPCNFGYYLTSTPITLTAMPASGYQFTGWTASGGSLSSASQRTTVFTINNDAQVTAAFSVIPACTYAISPTSAPGSGGGGSDNIQVTGSPTGCSGSWSASASSSGGWLTLTGTKTSSGSGLWQVPYSYSPNPSTTSTRTGTVTFTGSFPSGATFTLTQNPASNCTLTMTAPNGGETWTTGQQQSITWTSSGSACGSTVKVELLKGGSVNSTITSSTSNDGSYPWTPSASLATGADYTIRITDTANSSYYDTSNSSFTIAAASSCTLGVTAPNGGENWTVGQPQTIAWTSNGGSCGNNVTIELLAGGSLERTITSSTSNDGNFSWTPPANLSPGSNYTTRVTDTANASYSDTSNSAFTISASSTATATYDPTLKAPKCSAATSNCDSGSLLVGRGQIGPEPNAPNTIVDSCIDGDLGTFHSDESVDRIAVKTEDGSPLSAGRPAKVEVTIWGYGEGDVLDIYHASNATSPVWMYLGSGTILQGGEQVWNLTYDLPDGNLQAFRAQLRWQGDVSTCSTGNYDDHDDLIFAVQSAGVTVAPTSGLITSEAGVTAQFTVRLNSTPTADVTIPVVSGDTTEGTVSISSLTFTTSNWSTPQTVTVTGVDDAIHDGNVAYTIILGAASSADPAYGLFDPPNVAATNSDNDVLSAPVPTATFSGGTNVDITWSSVTGANAYELQRSYNGGAYVAVYSGAALSYSDPSCPGGTTCVYRTRAVDSLGVSAWRVDIATAMTFTDPTLTAGTMIKAVHLYQLRTAVNAVRKSAGLSEVVVSDSALNGVPMKAIHVTELRSALDAARAAIGVSSLSYTRVVAPATRIHAIDLTEIRNGTT